VSEKLKYFELPTDKIVEVKKEDGTIVKENVLAKCRTLTFDRDFLGADNKARM
jgi:hypothetical protein